MAADPPPGGSWIGWLEGCRPGVIGAAEGG
jgi:hypothetical protein